MRIISGKKGGHKLRALEGKDTRPTLDRVKESVFSMIAPYIVDANCLDLFAGSGGIGFELLSRGARGCILVDSSYRAVAVMRENEDMLGLGGLIFKMDFRSFLDSAAKDRQVFDIIYLDPPFGKNFYNDAINEIMIRGLISKEGIIICEMDYNTEISPEIETKFRRKKIKKYGNIKISVFYME